MNALIDGDTNSTWSRSFVPKVVSHDAYTLLTIASHFVQAYVNVVFLKLVSGVFFMDCVTQCGMQRPPPAHLSWESYTFLKNVVTEGTPAQAVKEVLCFFIW